MSEVRVEAFAGGSYPEHPRRLYWCGRWWTVRRVVWSWRVPEALCFLLETEEGARLRVDYEVDVDRWVLYPPEDLNGENLKGG